MQVCRELLLLALPWYGAPAPMVALNVEGATSMVLFGFDICITRHYIKWSHKRPPIWFDQGHTPDDWEAGIGPWYVVVSRIRNRRGLSSN